MDEVVATMDISEANEGYASCGSVIEMSRQMKATRAGVRGGAVPPPPSTVAGTALSPRPDPAGGEAAAAQRPYDNGGTLPFQRLCFCACDVLV
uniref:Uncharacterized protein n=1 Tax=Oryza sativa subsp. japonica TaxID=39947 RepID=Q652Z1_ORYSJ|nr:hypothetical protein [Oryza sativa Japonica Group]BAD54197.1 hypothetical protein [Oryza sativa Japonica Group]